MDNHPMSSKRGFSLIEMVLVISVFALVVSFLIPVGDHYLGSQFRNHTREEMTELREAILAYARDTGEVPSELKDLSTLPSGLDNWQGPYLQKVFSDDDALLDDFRYDDWHTAYGYAIPASQSYATARSVTLTSFGEDRRSGGGDDIELIVDLGPVFREETQIEIEILNNAIQAWNRDHLPWCPLPNNVGSILSTLSGSGYLPIESNLIKDYQSDGWGNPYLAVGTPVQTVSSTGGGN